MVFLEDFSRQNTLSSLLFWEATPYFWNYNFFGRTQDILFSWCHAHSPPHGDYSWLTSGYPNHTERKPVNFSEMNTLGISEDISSFYSISLSVQQSDSVALLNADAIEMGGETTISLSKNVTSKVPTWAFSLIWLEYSVVGRSPTNRQIKMA